MSKQLQHRLIFKYTSNNLFSSYINACFYTGLTKLQIFQPIVLIQHNSTYTIYYEFDLVLYFCTFDTFVPAYKTLYFISYIKNGKAEYQTQFIFVWYFAFTCDVHGNSTKRN